MEFSSWYVVDRIGTGNAFKRSDYNQQGSCQCSWRGLFQGIFFFYQAVGDFYGLCCDAIQLLQMCIISEQVLHRVRAPWSSFRKKTCQLERVKLKNIQLV
ncbi:MAG: hypothetical protein ACRCTU_04335 [Zoogloea sp.]|uniref:hypothetical protein n=1 Tax=Zoogloea sp. TaxID=49181 RepID=UPI003F2FDE7B